MKAFIFICLVVAALAEPKNVDVETKLKFPEEVPLVIEENAINSSAIKPSHAVEKPLAPIYQVLVLPYIERLRHESQQTPSSQLQYSSQPLPYSQLQYSSQPLPYSQLQYPSQPWPYSQLQYLSQPATYLQQQYPQYPTPQYSPQYPSIQYTSPQYQSPQYQSPQYQSFWYSPHLTNPISTPYNSPQSYYQQKQPIYPLRTQVVV